jgi:ABC-2 type transport system permease protein
MNFVAHADRRPRRLPLYLDARSDAHRPQLSENSARQLIVQTWVQTQRLLIRWGHDAQTIIEALILPCMLLAAINLVFGKPVSSVSGHSALYGSVPMAALVGAVFGSTAGGICLMREREEGLLARFWVLPVHRASGLLSRLSAEVVRILVTTVVVMCAGLLLGFRFKQGIVSALAWLAVPATFGVAFSFVVTTTALYVANTVLAEATGMVVSLLFFFCTGFVPPAQYPSWIRPVVEHQPMSYAVEAMRGLACGGPVLTPMVGTLLWSAGIVAVCAAPMVIGYRKASMR